jgi:hypothetical protein
MEPPMGFEDTRASVYPYPAEGATLIVDFYRRHLPNVEDLPLP